jgi:hypothetical protein
MIRQHCAQIGVGLAAFFLTAALIAQTLPAPPANGGIFPLDQVRAGQKATAWTVFRGNKPEPMDVEILGVLRGARGPGQDMILAQLHGAKPEYTGVVAGMSGSPVYIDGKLVGALAYRIGQFAKDPIAGITPIERMLAVHALPVAAVDHADAATAQNMQPMETPLVLSGFSPAAIGFWQKMMAGTGLETVAAGGSSSFLSNADSGTSAIEPGAAVSAQLARGDLEIAATCTVTYADPQQILACGHPILQSGTISLPMTEAEVILTLASPLNSYKIVNTGRTIGAFTEDRDAAIRGVLGARAQMLPVHVTIGGTLEPKQLHVEVANLAALTPQLVQVVLMQALQQSIQNTEQASYHLTGSILLADGRSAPVDDWAVPTEMMQAPVSAAIQLGQQFQRIYANSGREQAIQRVELHVEPIERRAQLELVRARLVRADAVHAGENVEVEVTVQPWQQAERTERIQVALPTRLGQGTARLVVADGATLDQLLHPAQIGTAARSESLESLLAEEEQKHAANRLYVGVLEPEAQATIAGQTLSNLPLSVTSALEPLRASQNATLHSESIQILADLPLKELFHGFAVLNLHIENGGGLN